MNFIPFVIVWGLMGAAVLALFIWRKAVASKEDDNIHVLDGASAEKNAQQLAVAQKLEVIDRWGKIVTIIAVVYGVVLSGAYAWHSWVINSKIGA